MVIGGGSSNLREFRLADHCSSITFRSPGGKGIRTPDFQLAKLALYQLSYAPCEFSILNCELQIANRRGTCAAHSRVRQKPKPDVDLVNRHPAFVRFFERAKLRSCARKAVPFSIIAQ
jgi:hypothetical protein